MCIRFTCGCSSVYCIRSLKESASLYIGAACLNTSSFAEIVQIRIPIAAGNCFNMEGGWFDCLWMYNGESLGFQEGAYLPIVKVRVISRKFTIFRFTSIFTLSPSFLKSVVIVFCIRSVACPDVLLKTVVTT